MAAGPVILSPALPSELLAYIIQHQTYPTTLIICSSRAEFLAHLISDVQDTTRRILHPGTDLNDPSRATDSRPNANALLASPLYQVAIARHIRMVFVPTVSHLRAYLSAFTNDDSKVPPPPASTSARTKRQSLLLVYGFLNLHCDTSEWSAQGISSTAASLVEAATRAGFRAVIVDHPRRPPRQNDGDGDEAEDGDGDKVTEAEDSLLSAEVTVLSSSARRAGADLDDAAWTGRKVTVGRVLGRWFRYGERGWGMKTHESV
ncbi:hypothetical protein VM1G_03820 [Cytospora mali]|uniref:Uncharacterized protein n=1 Tax=Cytospora mali TaxID=578113 RepID=A0A194VXG4_CYTMA|nr:hypothetical protein VM1G_03820 [Valsa mali]